MSENPAEEKESAQEPKEPTFADKLKGLLSGFDGAPDTSTVEAWKSVHGDIFCSAFSDDELFIFRPLTRNEYRSLQASVESEEDFEVGAVNLAVLWSSVIDLEKKAGTIPTLLEQVMQNSNFMPPQLAASLVVKL